MPTFSVDFEKCVKCGICVQLCPVRHLDLVDDGFPEPHSGEGRPCIGCGHCVAFCPQKAVSLLEDAPESGQEKAAAEPAPVEPASMPDPAEVSMLLRSRRSIRSFKEEAVPRKEVEAVLADANYAPTAKNARAFRWVLVHSQEKARQVGDLMADAFDAYRAENPSDPNGRIYAELANAWRKGRDPFLRGAPHIAVMVVKDGPFAKTDSAITLTYFEIAAHARGIGCCWGGYLTSCAAMSAPLREFFGLAADEIVGGAQMFGYPKIKPKRLAPRTGLGVKWLE